MSCNFSVVTAAGWRREQLDGAGTGADGTGFLDISNMRYAMAGVTRQSFDGASRLARRGRYDRQHRDHHQYVRAWCDLQQRPRSSSPHVTDPRRRRQGCSTSRSGPAVVAHAGPDCPAFDHCRRGRRQPDLDHDTCGWRLLFRYLRVMRRCRYGSLGTGNWHVAGLSSVTLTASGGITLGTAQVTFTPSDTTPPAGVPRCRSPLRRSCRRDHLPLQVTNNTTGSGSRDVLVYPANSAAQRSNVSFNSSTRHQRQQRAPATTLHTRAA